MSSLQKHVFSAGHHGASQSSVHPATPPTMPSLPLWTVDAFATQPFQGNPAAVCLLEEELPDTIQQDIARQVEVLTLYVYLYSQGGGPL